jgi:hypothetical protein
MRRAPQRPDPNDDLLGELPPLDDDDGPAEEPDASLLDRVEDDRAGDLDDSNASDLCVGELLDPLADDRDALPDDEAPGEQVPVTWAPIADERRSTDDDDAEGIDTDDAAVGIDGRADVAAAERADEVQGDPRGEEIDEAALPALDADDATDLDGGLGDEEDASMPDEIPLPPPGAEPWQRVPTPLVATPMSCVSVAPGSVLAAGSGAALLQIDSTGQTTPSWLELEGAPAGEWVAVAIETSGGTRWWGATRDGVFVSADAGASIAPALIGRGPASSAVRDLCLVGSKRPSPCLLTTAGLVTASGRGHGGWHDPCPGRTIRALARGERGTVFALATDRQDAALLRSDDGLAWTPQPLAPEAARVARAAAPMLAVRGATIVVAEPGGAAAVSRDEGASWRSVALPSGLTALAVGEDDGRAVVLATVFVESEDRSCLLAVDEQDRAWRVADLSPDVAVGAIDGADESEGTGRADAIAWDEHRGWAWVAGRFGLVAWRPGMRS